MLTLLSLSVFVLAMVSVAAAVVWMIPEVKTRYQRKITMAADAIDMHVGGQLARLVSVERSYPLRAQADLQRFINN